MFRYIPGMFQKLPIKRCNVLCLFPDFKKIYNIFFRWLSERAWISGHIHVKCPRRMFSERTDYSTILNGPAPDVHSDFSRLGMKQIGLIMFNMNKSKLLVNSSHKSIWLISFYFILFIGRESKRTYMTDVAKSDWYLIDSAKCIKINVENQLIVCCVFLPAFWCCAHPKAI